ncbi:MAG: hypothetical protein ACR5LD_02860 [Symbiopectobacterium sp.]
MIPHFRPPTPRQRMNRDGTLRDMAALLGGVAIAIALLLSGACTIIGTTTGEKTLRPWHK